LEHAGTSWNKLEQAGTSWNKLEQAGTSWNKLEQDGTRWNKVQVRKLFGIGGAKLVHQGKPSRGLIGERLQGIKARN